VARVILGVLLLLQALRAAGELRQGYFGDAFHWPLVPESFVPSRAVYGVLVAAQVVAALLVVLGPLAREALLASALLGGFVLACDRVQFHHNRYALVCYAFLLAFAPCERSLRLGLRGTRAEGPLFAARLAQLQVAIIYLASGSSKLLDPDWRGGRVLLERFTLFGSGAIAKGVPAAWVQAATDARVTAVLAAAAIAMELSLAVLLWWRPTRAVALWCGVWFHLTIEASSRVEGFTWLTLAIYALFATPDARARSLVYDPTRPVVRAAARAIAALDILERFDVRSRATDGETRAALVAIDRDGTRAVGLGAWALVARCVPVAFPLWLPLAGVAAIAVRRRPAPVAPQGSGGRPA
jgi:hypothetical protein